MSRSRVISLSSTRANTINTAPMMGPKKNTAPPRKVNNKKAPERRALTTSAVTISKFSADNPPEMPMKKPEAMNAK